MCGDLVGSLFYKHFGGGASFQILWAQYVSLLVELRLCRFMVIQWGSLLTCRTTRGISTMDKCGLLAAEAWLNCAWWLLRQWCVWGQWVGSRLYTIWPELAACSTWRTWWTCCTTPLRRHTTAKERRLHEDHKKYSLKETRKNEPKWNYFYCYFAAYFIMMSCMEILSAFYVVHIRRPTDSLAFDLDHIYFILSRLPLNYSTCIRLFVWRLSLTTLIIPQHLFL